MDSVVRVTYPVMYGLIILFSIIEYNAHHNFHSSGRELASDIYSSPRSGRSLWAFLLGGLVHYLGFWLAGAAAMTQAVGGTLNCSTQSVFIIRFIVVHIIFVIIRGFTSSKSGEGGYGGPS
ncbi:hypothetical protein CPB84DRAFT_1792834, partial [Gymnopilus junonius]